MYKLCVCHLLLFLMLALFFVPSSSVYSCPFGHIAKDIILLIYVRMCVRVTPHKQCSITLSLVSTIRVRNSKNKINNHLFYGNE